MTRPSRQDLLAAAAHVGLALLASWPMAASPMARLVGHQDVDVWNHAWGPWWFWTCLSQGRLPYRTDLLLAPDGGVLWYIDPIGALAGAPLVPIFGATLAYNAVILSYLALASLGARRLARALGASQQASWLASAAICCSPYLGCEVHNGISEVVGICWLLFALAAGWRAVEGALSGDRFRARPWLVMGAWMALTAVGSYYYAAAAGLVLACWALLALRRHSWLPLCKGALLACVVAGMVVVPLGLAIHATTSAADAIALRGSDAGMQQEMLLRHNAVDLRSYFWPGLQSVDLAAMGERFLHSSYLGLLALVLALASRRWRALAGALCALVVGLGAWLWWDGDWVTLSDGRRLALPFHLLLELLPASAATHAQRMGFPALAVVAGLAAVSASRLPRPWLLGSLALVAAEGLLAGPWPLPRTPRLDLGAHQAIAARPPGELRSRPLNGVLDLPVAVGNTMATSRYLFYQTVSGRPIPYRPDARGGASSLVGLHQFWVLAAPSMVRSEHRDALMKMASGIDEIDRGQLAEHGIQWVVLHRELERGEQNVDFLERQLTSWYGDPEVYGSHALYSTRVERNRTGYVLPLP